MEEEYILACINGDIKYISYKTYIFNILNNNRYENGHIIADFIIEYPELFFIRKCIKQYSTKYYIIECKYITNNMYME